MKERTRKKENKNKREKDKRDILKERERACVKKEDDKESN